VSTPHKEPRPSVWNSLEVCKLFAMIATPIVVLIVGCLAWSAQRSIVESWERDQAERRQLAEADIKVRDKVRDVRLTIYREAAPLINDIISYHFYVGRWRERSPADIIDKKRQLDTLLYSHRPLLTPAFFNLYHDFMRLGFRGARDFYSEPRIRTLSRCRSPRSAENAEQWSAYFTNEDTRQELCASYTKLLDRVADELLMQSFSFTTTDDKTPPAMCPPTSDTARC
jgi:hypothetical protein